MTERKHTELPWSSGEDSRGDSGLWSPQMMRIADGRGYRAAQDMTFAAHACNSHYALIEALEVGIKWMEWWLDQHECDCEEYHICGRRERQRELEQMRATLKQAKAND